MNLYADTLYIADVHSVSNMRFPWNRLKDKSLMLSGATGLIGSFLVDVILEKNISECD